MTCRYSENDIALYIGGDLTADLACEVQTHLQACSSCRNLATSLGESQAALKSLRLDSPNAAMLSAVRMRVLAEIGSRPVRWRWMRWAYAVAGAIVVVLLGFGAASRMRPAGAPAQLANVSDSGPPAVAPPLSNPIVQPAEPAVTKPPLPARGVRSVVHRTAVRSNEAEVAAVSPEPVPEAGTEEQAKPLMVKLLTDDPNVVIYWLVDQKNGGKS